MRHKTNGNKEGGRELASGVFQSQVIWGYISCSTGRKKHRHKLATKEHNESEMVSVGVGVGETYLVW